MVSGSCRLSSRRWRQLRQVADLRLVGDDGIERASAPDGQMGVRCQALDDDILSGQPPRARAAGRASGAKVRSFPAPMRLPRNCAGSDVRTADDGIRAGRRVEDEHRLKRDALAARQQHFIQRQCRGVDAAIDQCNAIERVADVVSIRRTLSEVSQPRLRARKHQLIAGPDVTGDVEWFSLGAQRRLQPAARQHRQEPAASAGARGLRQGRSRAWREMHNYIKSPAACVWNTSQRRLR